MNIRRGTTEGAVQLAYEDIGDPGDPAVLLIMGFSAQLTMWPDTFVEPLVAAGYRVIRFDNRDIGLSTKFDGVRVEGDQYLRLARFFVGQPSKVPYTLVDMAEDTRRLLDSLGIAAAHIVGASMGGMIAQILTATYPERVRSLGILFSSTNQPFLPPADVKTPFLLMGGPGKGASREERIAYSVKVRKAIQGPGYPTPDAEIEKMATDDYERSYAPAGIIRQLAAAMGTGSLLKYTKRIDKPTVVVHGTKDPLLHPAGGRAIASAVRGSRYYQIDGMGHDIPDALAAELADIYAANMARA